MKSLKPISVKHSNKKQRERQVLFGLVEYYIETGKAVGSNTLREHDFQEISSATIRNYFMKLEKSGYLIQEHSSAGRIPSESAYRLYANEFLKSGTVSEKDEKRIHKLRQKDGREINAFLQQTAELLGDISGYAVFLSAPRFDHDFITDLKLVRIDHTRCLCILVTDFGMIKTEVLHTENKLSSFSIKRIESYFRWRLTNQDKPSNLNESELRLAQNFYNEILVRYIVGYSNFSNEDLYRTGFSKLLAYPEFGDAKTLASGLALFENITGMRHLLKECNKTNELKFWIGEDLTPYSPSTNHCSVIAVPYYINKSSVGAIALLGPTRIPYRKLFGILHMLSQFISESLTKNIYKFKISFRQPKDKKLYLGKKERFLIEENKPILLEDKSQPKHNNEV